MQVTLEELEQALIDEYITPQQFLSVLIDNFGFARTMEIVKYNLELHKDEK